MPGLERFQEIISGGYTFKGDSILLGAAMHEGECQTGMLVSVPLKTLNRHGLIAGATGTGKTKTMQILAEQLSAKGIPVLMMDVKGDLSGIAAASEGHPKIDQRHEKIGFPFKADSSPVEFLTLSQDAGLRLRATVAEFGPVLFSKILGLNDIQSGITAVVFKYCDDQDIPLLDLKDFRKTLQYLSNEGKDEIEAQYGSIASSSVGSIMRKVVELEQQGADTFFGEPSFEVDDLCRIDEYGKGMVNVLRLTDIQDKPRLFSTFMLQLLAEIYATFPEEGDQDQPKLVMFIDEAHLIFEEAPKVLLDQLEVIVKLIRSKGVGVFFVTQNPADVPADILGQLGLKIQHSLRAFTAKDRKAIKLAAENFPDSEFYEVDQLLTQMGIGEALVTVLNEKGIPTPLVHAYLRAPQSRMDVLLPAEIQKILRKSALINKYDRAIDRDSAHEILQQKIEAAREKEHQEKMQAQHEKAAGQKQASSPSTFDKILSNPTTRQIGRAVARELTRGLLGVLGVGSTTRKRRR